MSEWKYTIPVARAIEENGKLFLVGEASGPERDTFGTRMLPEAITDFARQIRERMEDGNPIPYLDDHARSRTALVELGAVVDGSITPTGRLRVRVELDETNPAAVFIHGNAARGKKYGMSVKGHADPTDVVVMRTDNGGRDIAFKRVLLGEISNTTSPSWVPSLGTVIARSLDGEGDTDSMSKTAEELAAEAGNESAPEAPAAEAEAVTTPERTTEEQPKAETEVERARISKKDNDAIVAAFGGFITTLKDLGVELPNWEAAAATTPKPAETPETTKVENSEKGESDENTVDFGGIKVQRTVAEAMTAFVAEQLNGAKTVIEKQAEYIKTLEDMPAGKKPTAVVRSKFENPLDEVMSIEDPNKRLEAALNLMYNNH